MIAESKIDTLLEEMTSTKFKFTIYSTFYFILFILYLILAWYDTGKHIFGNWTDL